MSPSSASTLAGSPCGRSKHPSWPIWQHKLNALGIFTFDQVSKMTAKIEEEVNEAIEFFPGRVRRDEWARQAGELARD